MKKSIFFLIIVLIVIALSFTIVINSVNGKNKSDLNFQGGKRNESQTFCKENMRKVQDH